MIRLIRIHFLLGPAADSDFLASAACQSVLRFPSRLTYAATSLTFRLLFAHDRGLVFFRFGELGAGLLQRNELRLMADA